MAQSELNRLYISILEFQGVILAQLNSRDHIENRNDKPNLFIYDKEKYFFWIVYDPWDITFTESVTEIF